MPNLHLIYPDDHCATVQRLMDDGSISLAMKGFFERHSQGHDLLPEDVTVLVKPTSTGATVSVAPVAPSSVPEGWTVLTHVVDLNNVGNA
jgi:hypothetical protein